MFDLEDIEPLVVVDLVYAFLHALQMSFKGIPNRLFGVYLNSEHARRLKQVK